MINISKSINKVIAICKFTTNNYVTYSKIPSQMPLLSIHKPRQYCNSQSDSENVLSLDDKQIDAITQGNEELSHKLRVLLLEAEIMRQEGKAVPSPSSMKISQWKELLSLESRSGRRKYLEFLFKLEKKRENQQAKKVQKQIEREERPPLVIDGPVRYDLGHNTMFIRFYDTTINNFYNTRLFRAMQFSQKIVIDCGYYNNMSQRENVNCAKQLTLAFAENRLHNDPFDLHYCNLTKSSVLEDYFHRMVPTMYEQTFPINVHEASYMDLFPKENIVYLTPHCRNELEEYDHDAVYVIGGIVDKINNEPLSLAKAKREGLKMAKLPLDKHLMWGSGSGKSLTVNQVLSIMLDVRLYKDWELALRHVPKRKLMSDEDLRQQRESKPRWRSQNGAGSISTERTRWKPSSNDNQHVKERLLNLKNILNE